jgi:hypothetical protein
LNLGKNDKIITNTGINPTRLFFINREGWALENESLYNSDTINYSINHGAKYAIIFKDVDNDATRFKQFGFTELGAFEDFNVFELDSLKLQTFKSHQGSVDE